VHGFLLWFLLLQICHRARLHLGYIVVAYHNYIFALFFCISVLLCRRAATMCMHSLDLGG
jgi:hypothetical protein